MDNLRSFYKSIDLDAIHEFVKQRRQEDLFLEFKTLGNSQTFEKPDRKNLARAVSGFGNAEGGIVVWGVLAKPQPPDEIDGAVEVDPIRGLRRAHSDLVSHTAFATRPNVPGVDSRMVPDGNDSGYLVTYVPATEGHPCMAKLGEDRYIRRHGASFLRMEPGEIADMFGRRARPVLELYTQVKHTETLDGPGMAGRRYTGKVVLGIKNTGRGIARFPYIALTIKDPYKAYFGNRRTGLPKVVMLHGVAGTTAFAGGANDVVHVDSVLEVTWVDVSISHARGVRDLVIDYQIMAEGIPPVEGKQTITTDELVAAIVPADER